MRKLLFFLFFLPVLAGAQAPSLLSYQSVIRDANNNLLVNKEVTIQITILKDTPTGDSVYQELHPATTNQNGLAYVVIGRGIPIYGRLDTIKWAAGNYFIKSETDPEGGNNFQISVTTQILSVPYALHAATAEKLSGTYQETDPDFNSSPAKSITALDIDFWRQKLDPIDTIGLSNRINGKLSIADTSAMLSFYLRKGDTLGFSNLINSRLAIVDTAAMLNPYLKKADTSGVINLINARLAIADTAAMLDPYLKKADTTGISNRINARLALADTAAMLNPYLKKVDTVSISNRINARLTLADTAAMLNPYLKKADTVSISNRINARLALADTTAMLNPYLKKVDTLSLSNRVDARLALADTAAMLTSYLKKVDTLSLSNRINGKLSVTDTAVMLNPYLKKVDTLSLSNRIDAVGLPQSGNTPGSMLYWNGTSWTRLSAGRPGQVLTLSPDGLPIWAGTAFPSVVTNAATSVTNNSAQASGTVVDDGMEPPISEYGFVYATTPNPTTANLKLVAGATPAGYPLNYSNTLSGLTPGTTYYYRAYAINPIGTGYGAQQTFTTPVLGSIAGINCGGAVNTGTLVAGKASVGISSSIPYTGGNGGFYGGQVVNSTGVTGLTATLVPGLFATGAGDLSFAITGTPSGAGAASFVLSVGGQTCTLALTVVPGSLANISCTTARIVGSLISGVPAAGVSARIPYAGGNGGSHSGQTSTSTGITGLTATLAAGNFATGNDSLTYTITGTPSGNGIANFPITLGSQTCNLAVTVIAGSISSISCATAVNNGTLTFGLPATGVNSVISYTGGNGGSHAGQVVTSTGVLGLTATLTAANFASGAGTLTYTITGTPASTGTASFAISIGGQTCTLERTVVEGTISTITCGSSTTGSLVSGAVASGVTFTNSYTGGNGGKYNAKSITSSGVLGLTAALAAGTFKAGDSSLVYTISGTPSGSGTANFIVNIGGQSCLMSLPVAAGSVASLDCISVVISGGTLKAGVSSETVSFQIPYTGGNGGIHSGQTVSSSGISGLVASLAPGNFSSSSGTLTYQLSGTPSAAGTVSFAINIGGQTCTVNLVVAP